MNDLTHINERGEARMVDVADKTAAIRLAVAEGYVFMSPETMRVMSEGAAPKGDVLAVARIAGIMAAKRTHELIPLCHPLPLTSVGVSFDLIADRNCVRVEAFAKTVGKTGVEMEALTAVSVACLTLYDMLKARDKAMHFDSIRLLTKTGGKSGEYRAEAKTLGV